MVVLLLPACADASHFSFVGFEVLVFMSITCMMLSFFRGFCGRGNNKYFGGRGLPRNVYVSKDLVGEGVIWKCMRNLFLVL